MRWLDHRETVPDALRGAIIALGNFDGFHKGHQAVAGEAISWAHAEGRPSIIATFDPHPVRFFKPDVPPFRLTTLEQRQELYLAAGATAMLVFHFDSELAGTSAEDFITEILIDRFGAHGVVTGGDFTFGQGAKGNVELLRSFGGANGLQSRVVDVVEDDSETVSSSRIREALRDGDPQLAAKLLTRPFAIRGIVEHGDKRGRELGYPTANLVIDNYLRPKYGIYAVTGRILSTGEMLEGAASVGIRPQFEPPKELLEPYFFDFSGDLYGQKIEVAFHHFLRGEAKFDSLDELTAQMEKDCAEAKRLLSARNDD
ncbi:MAG: bifunctional riboflavin kinase/FMN adenylyltransferase [Altererythrobacter sp. XM-24bin4]|jgi:riboflavin kinase/FMN adenylyltransferase|uniref:bifunctional riboflavin kinase/FAD synthetase n=1 Tax=uncultured Altererythrobacter sp. TaxID=500840 RepID=UPI000D7B0EBF|nr:bifunctional riboflavin kinase/FAD synthetase [uncultured Altererythrobacter sp.]PWL25311.1 MAG: bifunctional riboflavin kinase/FMN adenylyltransferase [Altererythrobacter sp. XM-24bin4]